MTLAMPSWPPRLWAALAQAQPLPGVPAATLRPDARAPTADGSTPVPKLRPLYHIVLPVVIFVVSTLTISISRHTNLVSTLWPANAIMLAVLLCHARNLPTCISIIVGGTVATALASCLVDNRYELSAIMAAANCVEVIIALALLAAFQIGPSNLTSFDGILTFIFLAGGIAPIGSTLISATAYSLAHDVAWMTVWRNLYPGHALGMIILVPFLVSIVSSEWRTQRINERLPEVVAIFVLFVAISVCADYFRPALFVIAPAILLCTVRFGIIGATAATCLVTVIASVFVVSDVGQPLFLIQPELSQRIFGLQAFLAITSFWSLPTAALLTERDRLLRDLSQANSQLAADSERKSHLVMGLRRHLSMAEENERLRLSHELHDQAGQSLIAAILELNEIDALTSGAARARLQVVRKRMEEMGKTLHRIAWELRPPSIDELGLRKALASYVGEWSEQCGTEVDFHCDDPRLDEVADEISTAIYRVVQEGLTNIVKHARRPADVSVIVRRSDATLQVIVEDNGCGFDAATERSKTGKRRGLGLDGMRERLSLIGGALEVESAIGAGTTLFARIVLDGQGSAA
ncbi:MAG TPA: MASE1 domain-containing protein [Xanthobacteraceae bacterium]|nr:MASE1 domain-containing protein [Xanthobacteraceae bacterium]